MASSLLAALLVASACTVTAAVAIQFPGEGQGPECQGAARCLPVAQCPAALASQPTLCGFSGGQAKVCCPELAALVDISKPVDYDRLDCGRTARRASALRPSRRIRSLPPDIAVPRPPVAGGSSVPFPETFTTKPGETDQPVVGGTDVPLPDTDMVGGETPVKNAWPWMALLGKKTASGVSWFCGGVLISGDWVLSAYHCFLRIMPDVVRLGEHNYADDADGAAHIDVEVAEVVLYPHYVYPEAYHDLALIRLSQSVTLRTFYVSPVCLPWDALSTTNITGQQVTLTGWGDTEAGGTPSSVLQEVNLTVFVSSRCDQQYKVLPEYSKHWPRGIAEETVCAGYPAGGRDACQGDSGGPIVSLSGSGAVARYQLTGIVSQGYGCGKKDFFGLYASVRHESHLAWLKKVAFGS